MTLSTLPAVVPLICWWSAYPVAGMLGCQADFKAAVGCIAAGIDWAPLLGLLWLLGAILWIPGLLVTGLLIGRELRALLPIPWGQRP